MELAAFYDFISQDLILTELAEWAMSTKYIHHNRYLEYSITAVSIFLSIPANKFEVIRESRMLAEFLHNFLKSTDSNNAKLCGHFSRILGTQMRWGTPCMFLLYNDVIDLLLSHIDILAIREFLILTLQTSGTEVVNPQAVVEKLAEMTKSDIVNAALCLVDLFNTLSADHFILHAFCQPSVISNLLSAVVTMQSQFAAIEMLGVLTKLSHFDDCVQLTDSHRNLLTVSRGNITPLSAAAIYLVRAEPLDLFALFFEPESHAHLHDSLLKIFDTLSRDELIQIASIPDFISRLVDAYGTSSWCPHMFHIALMFSADDIASKVKNRRKWRRFLQCEFARVTRVMDSAYGGRLPNTSDDSDIETDDDNYLYDDTCSFVGFEEEEEEEEVDDISETDNSVDIDSDDSGELEIVV